DLCASQLRPVSALFLFLFTPTAPAAIYTLSLHDALPISLTIALLLPITYQVAPEASFILFAGIYYGAMYGGSTTSILLNTPGESATIVTALEGNRMARSGRGEIGRAHV